MSGCRTASPAGCTRRRLLALTALGCLAGPLLGGRPASAAAPDLPPPRRTVEVDGMAALEAALAAARPGDHIVLADGVYAGERLLVMAEGTATAPIVIRAASKLAATLRVTLQLGGAHLVVWGLDVEGAPLALGGTVNRVSRCRFSDSPRGAIHVAPGQDGVVEYCAVTVRPFEPGQTYGERFGLTVVSKSARRCHTGLHVYHNWFHDFSGKPDHKDYYSGFNHPCRIGESGTNAGLSLRATVERNLFENCRSEHSILEAKTSDNVFRGNTLLDCPNGAMINRTGSRNLWEANWIERAGGLRILGASHIVRGNTLVEADGLWIMAGDMPEDAATNRYPRAAHTLVAGNQGALVVGKISGKRSLPAIGTRIEAHHGTIDYELEEDTTVSETARDLVPAASRLTRAEVGPDAA